jgi:hypothetical protein
MAQLFAPKGMIIDEKLCRWCGAQDCTPETSPHCYRYQPSCYDAAADVSAPHGAPGAVELANILRDLAGMKGSIEKRLDAEVEKMRLVYEAAKAWRAEGGSYSLLCDIADAIDAALAKEEPK